MKKLSEKLIISSAEFYIKNTIIAIIYLILFTPLILSSKFFFPFIFSKMIYFRILVEVAIFLFIILFIKYPKYKPRLNEISISVLSYSLILTLASFFGVNTYKSFWGTVERGDGLLTFFHIIMFFFILTSVMVKKEDWYRFFIVSLIASTLVTLYGFGQRIGLSFVLSSNETRLTSSIGNASFLAGYLLMNIFLSIILFIKKSELYWKFLLGIIFIFQVYVMLNTGTRGAVLAFTIGMFILSFFYIILGKSKKIKNLLIILFLATIIITYIIWQNRTADWVTSNSLLNRLISISLNDVTTQSRLLTWKSSWKSLKDRPILGYGYENYNIAFNKSFPAEIFRDSGSQVWFDRAHNIIFDVLLNGGFLGLISYLTIYIVTFLCLWKHYLRNKEDWTLSLIISIGIFVYFLQNLFVFDTISTFILFYSYLAFIIYITSEHKVSTVSTLEFSKVYHITYFSLASLIIVFGFTLYYFNIRFIPPNYHTANSLRFAQAGDSKQSFNELKKALAYNDYQRFEIRQKLSEFVMSKNGKDFTQDEQKRNYSFAINEIKKSIEEDPLDVKNYLFLMSLYKSSAEFDITRLDELIRISRKAISISPTRPQIYFVLGQALIIQGRNYERQNKRELAEKKYKMGIEVFKKAVELNKKNIESNWNLAASYIVSGREEEAEKHFKLMEESLGFNYNSKENLTRLIKIYIILEDFREVASLYENLIEIEPNNALFHIKLAVAYSKIDRKEDARREAQTAVQIDSTLLNQAQNFINSLKNEKK